MLPWPFLIVALTGCESEETVVSEMERGLYTSHGAVALQLIATEILVHTFEEVTVTTARHGEQCGCPCVTDRVGESPPFIVTLDYDEAGCLPTSGIVPTTLAGHAVLEYDGSEVVATLSDFTVGLSHELTGALAGDVTANADEVTVVADLRVGSWSGVLEGGTSIDADGVTIDATIDVDGPHTGTQRLKGVQLLWADLPPPCPRPSSGTATLDGDKHAVVVDYKRPGDGFVTVERDTRVSESVDYCGYRTDLF